MNIQIPIQSADNTFLRLEFHKTEDRWAHSLLVAGPEQTKAVLTSVEGTSDDDYPASPPVQDIDRHVLPGGEALLSVGMAGNGHWSTSYSVDDSEGRPTIKADLACLLKKTDCTEKWLGSTYSVDKRVTVQGVAGGVRFVLNEIEIDLVANPEYASVKLDGERIVVTPLNFSGRKNEATRWLFSIGGVAGDP